MTSTCSQCKDQLSSSEQAQLHNDIKQYSLTSEAATAWALCRTCADDPEAVNMAVASLTEFLPKKMG
jgi:hypothetical protein